MGTPDSWGVSWGGAGVALGIWGISWSLGTPGATTPVYGAPFITLRAEMFDSISNQSEIIEYLSFESIIDEDA